jgi:hypothetical protein
MGGLRSSMVMALRRRILLGGGWAQSEMAWDRFDEISRGRKK